MSFLRSSSALALAALLAFAGPVSARQAVTSSRHRRLQDGVSAASGDLGDLRARDAGAARTLQGDLDELREEVIYLKVKLRKEGSVPRAEYLEMRDRLDDLRARATNSSGSRTSSASQGAPAQPAQPPTPPMPAEPRAPSTPRTAPLPPPPPSDDPRVTPGVVLDEPEPAVAHHHDASR